MTWILTTVLNWLGGGVLDRVLSHLETRANSETERFRIQVLREQHAQTTAANVVMHGMQFRLYWIMWCSVMAPLSFWFGWGMLDTTLNGALPDVAEIPPGLKSWAETAWLNVFYAGGGVAGAAMIARGLTKR